MNDIKEKIVIINSIYEENGYSSNGPDERVFPAISDEGYYEYCSGDYGQSVIQRIKSTTSNLLINVELTNKYSNLLKGDTINEFVESEFKKIFGNEYCEDDYESDDFQIENEKLFSSFMESMWDETRKAFKKKFDNIQDIKSVSKYMLVEFDSLPFQPYKSEQFINDILFYEMNQDKVLKKLNDFIEQIEYIKSFYKTSNIIFEIALEKYVKIAISVYINEHYKGIDYSEPLYFRDKRDAGKMFQKVIKSGFIIEKQ